MSKINDIVADGSGQASINISDEMRAAANAILDAHTAPAAPAQRETVTQRILREKEEMAPRKKKLALKRTLERGASSEHDPMGAAREKLLLATYEANPELDPNNIVKGDGQPDYSKRITAERSLSAPLNALVAEMAQSRNIANPPKPFGTSLAG